MVTAHAEAVPELETGTRAQLRVRADIIDRLVNEAGEVAIARARVEGELRSLKANLLELTTSVIRLRAQMREIEIQAESQIQSQMSLMQEQPGDFDPLEFDRYTRFQELTRSLAEGINDVSTVQHSLLKNLDDADAALLAQARLSRDVQQRLFSIRTVPFGSLSERLYRILRTTAKELDKRANLEIHGAKVELDRSVLEKLVGPLEHLLRNALDHGIETRDARVKSGKLETGEISLTVRQVGNEVVIDLADDGAGVDFARVRERARSLGLFAEGTEPTDAQLVEFLFQPGFSTASKVTQISGRGIGMDVVRAEVAALGGRVEVATTLGKGTRFTLTMPLTLAVAQAVLVRAGGRLWALPAPMVEQVQQIKSQALLDLYIQRKVDWQGREYPFHYLPRLLGDTVHNPETLRYNSVLLLRSGQTPRGDSRRRNGRHAGSRREEHRAAAGARVRNLRRDGAGLRRDRADHQPGAAGRTRRRPEIRPGRRRARGRRPPARAGRGRVDAAAGDDRRRFADGAQDHEPTAAARGLRGDHGQGRRRCAAAAGRADARRHPARHRNAEDGRLRIRQDDQGRSRSS